jgi:hypothetical protein
MDASSAAHPDVGVNHRINALPLLSRGFHDPHPVASGDPTGKVRRISCFLHSAINCAGGYILAV